MPGDYSNKKLHSRFLICGVLLIVSFTALSSRVVSLQWLARDNSAEAQKKKPHHRKEKKPAYRGLIVDRNEESLVSNIALNDLFVDRYHIDDENIISWGVAHSRVVNTPKWLQADEEGRKKMLSEMRFYLINNEFPRELIAEHKDIVVSLLAKPLKLEKSELKRLLNDPKRKYYALSKNLPETEALYIERIIEKNYLFGLEFKKHLTRHYTSPTLATHLIGFTRDYVGVAGIEKRYNSQLSGVDGFVSRKRNPNNLSIYSDDVQSQPPQPGLNVVLSIDASLQSIVEEELESGLEFAVAKKGCAILMNPETGEILAMASRPHYNLNTKEGVAEGSSNYIFKTAMEPGSTIKVLTIAAGLNEGHITPSTIINCEDGLLQESGVTVRDDYPRSALTVTEILAQSNNIGTYKIGRQVGRARHAHYLELFGLGAPTQLNWAGEVRTRSTIGASQQDFASSTFGYAISVTPMHMAIAYSAVANDGVMMKPILIKDVVSNDGISIERAAIEESHRVISERAASSLRKVMVAVTKEGGTGKQAVVPGYSVAGKTGTSHKWDNKIRRYNRDKVVCSFGGMMPANDPKLVCYIVVDEPQTKEVKRYGGTLAAPIFSKIAQRAALHMNIPLSEK